MTSRAVSRPQQGDDIQIIHDAEPMVVNDVLTAERPGPWRHARWLLVVVPWLWYLVRSLFAFMDVIAAGLPLVIIFSGLAALTVAVVRRSAAFLALVVSLVVFFVVSVLLPFRSTNGQAPTESIRVGTVNAGLYFFSDNDLGFLIFDEAPDLVVGVELAESHDAELQSRFRNAVTDVISLDRQQQNDVELRPNGDGFRRNGLPSIGVYSDLEMVQLDDPIADVVDGGLPGFRLQVATDSGDLIVYALHVPRPGGTDGPYEVSAGEHLAIANAIADAVDAETLPTIVLGDLNAVDRGQAYRTLTRNLEDGIRHSGAAAPTTDRSLPESLLYARVDHLLMSPGLCTANAVLVDTRWSDHHPVLADVGPC